MARAKEFDEDAVLLKAVDLFWEQGYEKTSMSDLVEHMGIHKRSLYDTFGDKHSLFMKALQRYDQMIAHRYVVSQEQEKSPIDAIRSMFERTVRQREDDSPRGCFIVNTAVELSTHDSECREMVNQRLNRTEIYVRELIEAGQHTGEIAASLNADWLASYFVNALTGLRVMVKTTEDRDKLNHIVDMTMSVLKTR
ncbi:TetR family transcriptional regulator [Paenibacillus taihuensis]|uniref:TetR family transcriptional regulator n=1 Tax=Paenibacillus taihuensis TaxID=1156355 RepID=A0A3D9SFS6_9BACL|nr:TetR/AcrR family transcriptional regulator [Paenibacillus taihuensis]REE89013.1 TetR family transcriptional regulator [Paenibacillus taihuensis]